MGEIANKRISILDLDALREAFKISAREHHVEGPDWPHFAEQFLNNALNSWTKDLPTSSWEPATGRWVMDLEPAADLSDTHRLA
jgi:hypothetical protein